MILSKHFVFVHFPKTGGTFVRRLCAEYAPAAWEITIIPHHPTISDIPLSYRHLPVLGFIRNPFTWYVSWYFYLKQCADNEFFNQLSDFGKRDFKTTLLTLFELDLTQVFKHSLTHIESPYHCYLQHTYGDLTSVELGRFEHLRSDLVKQLKSVVALPQILEQQILSSPKHNQGDSRDYRDYYDNELFSMVSERDAVVLKKWHYHFDNQV